MTEMPTCPRCGQKSQMVKSVTVKSHLKDDSIELSLNGYSMCRSSDCEVVYFGPNIYLKEDLKIKLWLKDPDDPSIPVCYCRGISTADIIEHFVNKQCCESWEDIKTHMNVNPEQACLTRNPAGV